MLVSIDKIIVKDRIRKDFGDISELAQDIKENGLIIPLVVIPESDGTFTLLAGERRLRAMKSLGKTDIEVRPWRTLTDEEKLNVEISENEVRKDFSKAERVEYGRRLERIEATKVKERQGERNDLTFGKNLAEVQRTTDVVASQLGIGSGEQYRKGNTFTDSIDTMSATLESWEKGGGFDSAITGMTSRFDAWEKSGSYNSTVTELTSEFKEWSKGSTFDSTVWVLYDS